MGGFDFEWKGKYYNILTEGGCPFFESDEELNAFEEWRVTPEGIRLFGPVPKDWSEEHYLDDRYPWDPERECRVDVEDLGKGKSSSRNNIDGSDSEDDYYDEPNIEWYLYEKCRYNCYRHFYMTNKTHECANCSVLSCKECAKGSFKKCSGEGGDCGETLCDVCDYCEYCEQQKKESKRGKGKKKSSSH